MDRSEEDIRSLLEKAKINPQDIHPVTQVLQFSDSFVEECNNTFLLELNDELLQALKQDNRLYMRGDAEDNTVICTKDKTFEVREAETSNSLVLVPDIKHTSDITDKPPDIQKAQVVGIHYKYLEARPCHPRYRKLFNLLEENLVTEDSARYLKDNLGLTWHDMLDRIQCSEIELQKGLDKFQAFEIDGFYYVLSFDYKFQVVSQILNLIESNSWPLNAVPKETTVNSLRALTPKQILNQCFKYFFSETQQISNENDSLYQINDDAVSRLCAEVLLKPAGKFNLADFINIWQQSVPEGVLTNLEQLEGIAVVDRSSSPNVIWHLQGHHLPEAAQERLEELFNIAPKWTLDQIGPYLEDLITPKQPLSVILNKYSRASVKNGTKYYSAKHLK